MQAIEFDAVVQDTFIPLPSSAALPSGQAVRVVVLYEETGNATEPASQEDAITRLARHPLIIPGFAPLSRDQAHER